MSRAEQATAAMVVLILLFTLVLFIGEWRRHRDRRRIFKQWQTSLDERKVVKWDDR